MKSLTESVILRELDPQPVQRVPAAVFQKWKASLIRKVHEIQATRTANHPIGPRLESLIAFIDEQCSSCTSVDSAMVKIEAGKFVGEFLGSLVERARAMKKDLIPEDDPFRERFTELRENQIEAGYGLLSNRTWDTLKKRVAEERRSRELDSDRADPT